MQLLSYNYKQPTDWTCGPAVARIILDYYGTKKSIRQLAKELRATRYGTSNSALRRLFKNHDIKFREKHRATTEDIKKHLNSSIVLVAYWIPKHKEAHYSIVRSVTKTHIHFHDTWFGSSHKYTIPYFLKNWRDDEAERWMLSVPSSSRR